jgi:hypothetical protein
MRRGRHQPLGLGHLALRSILKPMISNPLSTRQSGILNVIPHHSNNDWGGNVPVSNLKICEVEARCRWCHTWGHPTGLYDREVLYARGAALVCGRHVQWEECLGTSSRGSISLTSSICTATSTTRPVFSGLRLVDRQCPAKELSAIQSRYSLVSTVTHFDKCEAARSSGLPVHNELCFRYSSILGEQFS